MNNNYNQNPQPSSQIATPETESDTRNEPRVEVRAERPYISIPVMVNLKDWGQANALIGEIFEWLEMKGVQPNGAPFYRYWVIGDREKKFKLEVGVPVGNITFGDDRIIAGMIPKGKYAILVHNGHPDRIANSFAVLEEWAKVHGIQWDNVLDESEEVWGGRFEYYLTDPVVEPNLEKWSIEIAFKIKE